MAHYKNEPQRQFLPYPLIKSAIYSVLIFGLVRQEPKQVRLKGRKVTVWSNLERNIFSTRRKNIWTSKCFLQNKQLFYFRFSTRSQNVSTGSKFLSLDRNTFDWVELLLSGKNCFC